MTSKDSETFADYVFIIKLINPLKIITDLLILLRY